MRKLCQTWIFKCVHFEIVLKSGKIKFENEDLENMFDQIIVDIENNYSRGEI
jgi:hypothetical protein